MSLHHAAQHLASQGRYGDNVLVHMNPKEVAGLQALAEQKGTSLTTNPDTGMPEAFGLGDLNPFRIVQGKGEIGESGFGSMLIGAALMAAGMPPQMAGLMTGGATLAMGGNLRQALGQGLGAYGGASMAQSAGFAPTQNPNLATVADAGTAVPPAAPAAAPVAPPVNTAPTGMDFGGSSFTGVPPTEAAAQVATTTPPPAAAPAAAAPAAAPVVTPTATGPLTNAQVDVGLGKAGTYTPAGETSTIDRVGQFAKDYKWPIAGAGLLALTQEEPKGVDAPPIKPGKIRPYIYDPKTGGLQQLKAIDAPGYAGGGTVEQMSNQNAVGQNTGYPMADITGHAYATPWQTPVSQNVVQGTADTGVNSMTGQQLAEGGMAYAAGGSTSSLGGYASGGSPRLLKGPGDGMSDNIPAVIGRKQPARLADGEFVIPADVVSHLGNGSTDAGAKQLYKMMDRIRQQRTGKRKQAPEVNPQKSMPA